MSDPIDFSPIDAEPRQSREERVVRNVMYEVMRRPVRTAGLAEAILGMARPALLGAALVAVALWTARAGLRQDPPAARTVSSARALGYGAAAERLLYRAEPATLEQFIAAFGGEP